MPWQIERGRDPGNERNDLVIVANNAAKGLGGVQRQGSFNNGFWVAKLTLFEMVNQCRSYTTWLREERLRPCCNQATWLREADLQEHRPDCRKETKFVSWYLGASAARPMEFFECLICCDNLFKLFY